jgi:hypothetical protein
MMRTAIYGALPRVLSFYLAATAVLLCISLTDFVIWLVGTLALVERMAMITGAVIAGSSVLVWMYRRTGVFSTLTAELMNEADSGSIRTPGHAITH